jgi:hypothetical protein
VILRAHSSGSSTYAVAPERGCCAVTRFPFGVPVGSRVGSDRGQWRSRGPGHREPAPRARPCGRAGRFPHSGSGGGRRLRSRPGAATRGAGRECLARRSSSTSASRTSLRQVSVNSRSIVSSYRRPGPSSPPRNPIRDDTIGVGNPVELAAQGLDRHHHARENVTGDVELQVHPPHSFVHAARQQPSSLGPRRNRPRRATGIVKIKCRCGTGARISSRSFSAKSSARFCW